MLDLYKHPRYRGHPQRMYSILLCGAFIDDNLFHAIMGLGISSKFYSSCSQKNGAQITKFYTYMYIYTIYISYI